MSKSILRVTNKLNFIEMFVTKFKHINLHFDSEALCMIIHTGYSLFIILASKLSFLFNFQKEINIRVRKNLLQKK